MQHLYVSYPNDHYDLAHRLVDDLQSRGYVVFVDAVSEPGGMAWAAETRQAILSSGAMLILLDPAQRRVGIRHEGVLSLRGDKPVFVLCLSAGELPRYFSSASTIDFVQPYEQALQALLDELPRAERLMVAPTELGPRRPVNPPVPLNPDRRRVRRRVFAVVGLLMLLVIIGFAAGWIPV